MPKGPRDDTGAVASVAGASAATVGGGAAINAMGTTAGLGAAGISNGLAAIGAVAGGGGLLGGRVRGADARP